MGQLGKVGQVPIRLVRTWPAPAPDGAWQVFCPFLNGVDAATAFWIGGMAWHDANASLLASLRTPALVAPVTFAGVFCTDPFRREADIFAALRRAGVTGVVNLPSVSFFDGDLSTILASFNLGFARELEFLRHARDAGFRVALCMTTEAPVAEALATGAELIIAHDGPPQPGSSGSRADAAVKLRRKFAPGMPVISAQDLLKSLVA